MPAKDIVQAFSLSSTLQHTLLSSVVRLSKYYFSDQAGPTTKIKQVTKCQWTKEATFPRDQHPPPPPTHTHTHTPDKPCLGHHPPEIHRDLHSHYP